MSLSRSLRTLRLGLAVSILLAVSLLMIGCAEPTVDEMRAGYVVELNSWMAQPIEAAPAAEDEAMEGEAGDAAEEDAAEEDAAEEDAAEGDATEGEAAEGDAAEGEGEAAEEAAPATTSVLFDVVVRYNGLQPLSGLTLDITQADASQQEKAVYYHWVDTSSILKGDPYQESFTLENVPFVEGDLFSVSIREAVPESERGNYKEYSSAP